MIYFDNGATTKPYQEVIDSFTKVSEQFFANPSSIHRFGGEVEQILSRARNQISDLLHVKATEIVFTSGGTESNNLAIKGTAFMYKNRGNHIITSAVEHASVRETIRQLENFGFEFTVLPVDQEGRIRLSDLEKAITDKTILVSIMHVNNEVGTIQPIKEIGSLLKKYPKVLFHVDNVQGIGKVPLDLYESGVDLCSYSGHKFHGLKGTGILFIREGVQLSPLLTGGSQERQLRSGTENVAGFVSLAKALRMSLEKMETAMEKMEKIKAYMMDELKKMDGVTIHTPENHSAPHIVNFSVKGFKGEVFVHALEEKDIYVSTTSACSSKKNQGSSTLRAMNVPDEMATGAIRISLSYENTLEEAKTVINAIREAIEKLKEVMK